MVSGSVSLPSRGPFHRSFTVLYAIGHWGVFSLTGWSPLIPSRFHVSRCTLDPTIVISDFAYGAFTLSGWLFQNHSAIRHESIIVVLTPGCTHPGLGSFPFARRYSENRLFFLFLRLLRCFSSPGSPYMAMYSPCSDRGLLCRVSPFRHPRVNGHLHLSVAFRSLSRLSSALSAKASALRSY